MSATGIRTTVYVDAEKLLSYHPDLARLQQLDRTIARAAVEPGSVTVPELGAPPVVELPTPDPPAPAAAAPSAVDVARAETAIREDFEIRRRARPDVEEDRYRREMERLRRRYLELRREPRPEEASDDLALAVRNARRISELLDQLRSLQEKPEDRLFYNAAQLRRRRDLYRLTEQDLAELRREEARRLERALEPADSWARRSGGTPREIPEAEIQKADREREALRQEALALLKRLEQDQVAELRSARLPAPHADEIALDPPAGGSEIAAEREALEMRVQGIASSRAGETRPSEVVAHSLMALREERSQLKERLLQEVRTVAAAAGRKQRLVVSFTPGAGPDRTVELAGAVRLLLKGEGGGS